MVEESLIKRLMASVKCTVCGQCYEADNIDVLNHQDDLWFLSIFCSTCRARYLAAAVIKEGEVHEVITDLTEAELGKFRGVAGVTEDNMLDMHNFLKGFDGNFSWLFDQKQA